MSRDSYFRILLGRRSYGLIALVLAALFAFNYYILGPSNFSSFSNTLRYFISALSTLLAVVVSFNTLALRNQLNNMPNSMDSLNKQLDRISNLLQPITNQNKNDSQRKSYGEYEESATLYYTDAMKGMLIESKSRAEAIAKNHDSDDNKESQNDQEKRFRNICIDFIKEIELRLSSYKKYKNPYFLVVISSTSFIQRMKFNSSTNTNEQTKQLFEVSKRLHIVRNISARIYIRNSLTKLSFEMVVSTIPIITLSAIISAISNYGDYPTFHLRILFSASMSTVIMPFILLFVRTIPVLQLIHASSSIPFAQKNGEG